MSQSKHQIAVTGVDQTAKTFQSIQARAIATGHRIASVMRGALAAAGAYLSVRAVAGAVNELGTLSDLAMKAGTSVEFLTSATTAFQVAGLDISAENLARSMAMMQKTMGDKSFGDVIRGIAAIPDAAERAQAMMQVFGRGGLELMPLVNGGQEAINKFEELRGLMPKVSTSAANAGDEVNDAMKILGNGLYDLWLEVVGKICSLFTKDFPGGIRAGAENASNWLRSFFQKSWAWMKKWTEYLGALGEYLANVFDVGHEAAWEKYTERIVGANATYDRAAAVIDAEREEFLNKLKSAPKNRHSPFRNSFASEDMGASALERASPRVSNELILGGSNAANRLALLGPQYQNEMKKQTAALEKIVKNTEKTADNADATESPPVANF